MKKTFKKIVASIMAATLAVGTAGMSASAAQFTINLGRGEIGSVTVNKASNLSYALISITSENLSNSAYVYFCLKNSSGSAISASKKKELVMVVFLWTIQRLLLRLEPQ